MISLTVDGSPDGCRQAARDLRTLRARLTALADAVAAVRAGSSGAWTGLAGERFRTRTGSLVTSADEQAEALAAVASALDTLADRLEDVRAAMAAGRAIAVAAGIPVARDALPHATGLSPEHLDAHARALVVVGHAREREAEAQQSWSAVLARVPGSWRAATEAAVDLGPFERLRPLADRVDDLVPLPLGHGSPRWPFLPPIPPVPPLVPLPGPGVLGPGLILDQLTRVKEEVWAQMDEDVDREDLTLTERLARGVVMGTATGIGAFGGIALCMRFSLTREVAPVCGSVGSRAGEKAGDQILRAVDAR